MDILSYFTNSSKSIKLTNSYTTPEEYKSQLTECNTRFGIILGEYIEFYPIYKINPTYSGYTYRINNLIDNFTELKNDIFELTNSMNKDSDALVQYLNDTNTQVKELEENNTTLLKDYNRLLKSNSASLGAISYKREEYNLKLFKFIMLSASTIALVLIK